jgi:hypothetical protein
VVSLSLSPPFHSHTHNAHESDGLVILLIFLVIARCCVFLCVYFWFVVLFCLIYFQFLAFLCVYSLGVHVYRLINEVLCHVNVDLIEKGTIEKLVVSYYDGVSRASSSFAASFLKYYENSADNETTPSSSSSSSSSSNFPSSTSTPHKSFSSDKSTSPLVSSSVTPPSKHSTTNNQNSHSTNILVC